MIYSFVKQKIPSSRRSWNEGDGFVPSPCVYVLVLAKRRQDSEVWSVSKTLLQFEFTSAVSRCPEDPYTQSSSHKPRVRNVRIVHASLRSLSKGLNTLQRERSRLPFPNTNLEIPFSDGRFHRSLYLERPITLLMVAVGSPK